MEQVFTPEEQVSALATGQEEAQATPLPEEQYASASNRMGAWAARKIIKSSAKKAGDIGVTRADLYKKYDIKPKEEPEAVSTIKAEVAAPVDGELPPEQPAYSFNTDREAADIEASDISNFDTTDSFQMNFDTIEDGAEEVIAVMAEKNKIGIDEARRGVQTDEQLRGLADDLGKSPEFLKEVLSRKEGESWNAEKMLASRQVLEQASVKIKMLAQKVTNGEDIHIDADGKQMSYRLQFNRQIAFFRDFNAQFMGARAETGRSLRALGVPTGGNKASLDQTMDMITAAERGIDIDSAAASILLAKDVKAVNGAVTAIEKSITGKVFDTAYEVYINSILSGLKTHLVNAMGSKLRLWVDLMDTAVAARMGAGANAKPGDKVHVDEWKAGFFAQNLVSMESIKVALGVMGNGEAYKGLTKMESTQRRAIDAQEYGIDPNSMLGGTVNWIGKIVRAPTERLMGGTDALMRHQAERVHLVKAAYREAAHLSDINGLDEATTLKLLQDLIDNPTEKIQQEAVDFASDVTFQTPLGQTGKKFQQVVQETPGLRWIIPFVKTPANLLKQGFLERTPFGLMSSKIREDIAAGGVRAQMAKSKLATGTALGTAMWFMASAGKITGSDPYDKDVRSARHESGWRPRSFVFEDEFGNKTYYSYDRMEPLSYIIGAIADIYELTEESKYDTLSEDEMGKVERMMGATLIALSENTMDKSFMTGIRDFLEAATGKENYKWQNYIKRQSNGLIPYAGLRRDATRLMDDTKRMTDGIPTYIEANMFSAAQELPARLDNFGNEVHYDSVLNPWPKVIQESSRHQDEIGRLANSTRRAPIPSPSNKIGGVEMSAQEYHDYKLLSRKHTVVAGKTFLETIVGIMDGSNYDKMTDDEKVDVLRKTATNFDSSARKISANESPTLMEKLQRKTFIKAAQRKAKENGTEASVELEELKSKFITY